MDHVELQSRFSTCQARPTAPRLDRLGPGAGVELCDHLLIGLGLFILLHRQLGQLRLGRQALWHLYRP